MSVNINKQSSVVGAGDNGLGIIDVRFVLQKCTHHFRDIERCFGLVAVGVEFHSRQLVVDCSRTFASKQLTEISSQFCCQLVCVEVTISNYPASETRGKFIELCQSKS